MAAGLGVALHTAGLPVGPDRCERLARAVTVMGAASVAELRACALATPVSDPGQMATFDRVFAALFGTPSPVRDLLPPVQPAFPRAEQDGGPQPAARSQGDPGGWSAGMQVSANGSSADDGDEPLAERLLFATSPQPPSGCAAVTLPSCPRPNCGSWSRSCAR